MKHTDRWRSISRTQLRARVALFLGGLVLFFLSTGAIIGTRLPFGQQVDALFGIAWVAMGAMAIHQGYREGHRLMDRPGAVRSTTDRTPDGEGPADQGSS